MSEAESSTSVEVEDSAETQQRSGFKPLRVWLPIMLLAVTAVMWLIPRVVEDIPFGLVIASALSPAVCGVLIVLWWLLLSRATWKERMVGVLVLGIALTVSLLLLDKSMGMPGVIFLTFPLGTLAFAIGAILLGKTLTAKRTMVALLFAVCGFGATDLMRSEGMWGGDGSLELFWRWSPTHEEQMLAQRAKRPEFEAAEFAAEEIEEWLANPEWPEFRGKDRTSRQSGPVIATDWSTPPEQVWKISVGPGWSSFAVAGQMLFTQEQRGPLEMIVCYEADSGKEIWTQEVKTRFFESLGGPGPRATPTLAEGKLFAMGANGDLLRLEPQTGDIVWQVNLQDASGRKPPEWGFSSSPLVVGSNVIVHAGGEGDKGTLAFDVESGELKWSAPSGNHSYSSPQFCTIGDEGFALMLTNDGLDVLDPQSGEVRLVYPWEYEGYRVLQPQLVDGDSLLLATGMGVGTRRVQITNIAGELAVEEMWESRHLKPDFNDLVVYDGHAYGFDGAIFACIDLATGKRAWKGGRYGKGQVLLLEDAGLLLVVSESGEVVLVKADPAKRQELAKFQALEGKTWNHPVVVGDKLYIRNAQEAACYRLPLASEVIAVVGK